MIRVLLADDHALVRAGFRVILERADGISVVGEASSGTEALSAARRVNPDIVLMDVRMPDLDGIEATRRLRQTGPTPRIIILTTFDLDEYVYESLRAGASGFLLKDSLAADLVMAIRTVADGQAVAAPTVTRRLIEHFVTTAPAPAPERDPSRVHPLTARERDVLTLVARGLSNKEIAGALNLSEGTVKNHINHILSKLDLRDRVHAVILGYETGLV
jgi:DNA-binding NarL/FixJ family response regulator